jgi:hypothetical protein
MNCRDKSENEHPYKVATPEKLTKLLEKNDKPLEEDNINLTLCLHEGRQRPSHVESFKR